MVLWRISVRDEPLRQLAQSIGIPARTAVTGNAGEFDWEIPAIDIRL
jgi:hypothetical protein